MAQPLVFLPQLNNLSLEFFMNKNSHEKSKYQAILLNIKLIGSRSEVMDAEQFRPNDPLNFEVKLEIFVGIEGYDEGSERFDIFVCTPSMLEESLNSEDCVMGHGNLIVSSYSYEKIVSYIKSYINKCKGRTIDDVMRRVGLLGDWESEWEV